jgi:large subunit ribosomal protein L21
MKYVILESGGKQFRAIEGGTIEVDRLPLETGAMIKIEQVLLLVDGDDITVGTPLVKDVPVWTKVVEHFKGPKVNIFNYSPKKRIRVKIGHRQNYTRLLVEQIGGTDLIKKEPVKTDKVLELKVEGSASKKKTPNAKKPAKIESKSKTSVPKPTSTVKAKKPVSKVSTGTSTKPSSKKTSSAKVEPKSSPKGKTAPKKPAAKK